MPENASHQNCRVSPYYRWGLAAVVLIAVALRFDGITRAGIQFEDESAYAADARLWHRCGRVLIDPYAVRAAFAGDKAGVRRRMDEIGVRFEDRYDKPCQGYTSLGALAMFVVGDQPAALLVVNAFCGTITVLALYFLGGTLFTPSVGLAAALLLAVSPYHMFYCRTALADASAGCFCLIGVTLWALGRRRQWSAWRTYGLSGLAIGYSVICHYRYGYVVPVLLMLDGLISRQSASTAAPVQCYLRHVAVRWARFFAGLALPGFLLEAVFRLAQGVAFIADAHFPVKSFFQGVWAHSQTPGSYGTVGASGRIFTFHLASVHEYAAYFLHWHGVAAGLAVVLGTIVAFFARREAKLPACMVLITVVLLSAQPNLVARAMSTALPFVYLCLGAGLAWLSGIACRRLSMPAAGATLLVAAAMAVPSLPGAWHVLQRQSQLPDLCLWLARQGPGTAVVAEEPRKYELYLEGTSIEVASGRPWRIQLTPQAAIAEFRQQGIHWIIFDPQRWHYRDPRSDQREAVFLWWQELEDLLLKGGPPAADFDHVRQHRWEFLAEGPGLAYLGEMTDRNDGGLRVFALSPGAVPFQVSRRTGD